MPYIGAGIQRFNTADSLTVNGDAEVTGTVNPSGDTASGDAAAVGFTSTEGLILTGQGSTSDITVKNDADAVVFSVPTGTDDILFPDNAKAIFGAGSDLELSHNGTNSIIEGKTGDLILRTAGTESIFLQDAGGNNLAQFNDNSDVKLYHNANEKLATTSSGIDVTGTVTADGADLDGAVVINESSADVDFRVEGNGNANAFFVQGSDDFIGIGTGSPKKRLHILDTTSDGLIILDRNDTSADHQICFAHNYQSGGQTGGNYFGIGVDDSENRLVFAFDADSQASLSADAKMALDANGTFLVAKTSTDKTVSGFAFEPGNQAQCHMTSTSGINLILNRQTSDGTLVQLRHADTTEGSIVVSGSTVSYNGGHLARWSRLLDGSRSDALLKGTVMSNLDDMITWSHDEVLWTESDKLPKDVSAGDVRRAAYTEDNEQLNHTKVSDTEGDINAAGVFVAWDDDDDDYEDFYIAMTGDFVIRIAQDTTVARGDLLMSAGDGTAKPQGDDIVRSKTIAKVTSTTKSHTYDDGSYLIPCVLMAC